MFWTGFFCSRHFYSHCIARCACPNEERSDGTRGRTLQGSESDSTLICYDFIFVNCNGILRFESFKAAITL